MQDMQKVRSHAARLVIVLMVMALASCSTQRLPTGDPSLYKATDDKPVGTTAKPLVGMGISGGGNRSALFASYVIELLGVLPVSSSTGTEPVSFLSTLGYMSSVSGGSFATAYFGMINPSQSPAGFNAMLAPGGVPEPYASFFFKYHMKMNHNWFEAALFDSQPAYLSSWREQWLIDGLDGVFLNNMTFHQLDERELNGQSPYLIFNATHYDSGRRFVMTTIPREHFCINVEELLKDVLQSKGRPDKQTQVQKLKNLTTCDLTDPLTPEGFDSIGDTKPFSIVSQDIPLSYAVAMSAAFPVVVGPVAYKVKVGQQDQLFHVIDGGITDNSGVETITQLFLRKLNADKADNQQALIVELDAGKPFNAEGTAIKDASTPLSTIAPDPSRMSDIQEVRASLYRNDLWHLANELASCQTGNNKSSSNCSAQSGAVPKTSQLVSRLKILTLRHTDLALDPDIGSLSVNVDKDPVANGGSCHKTWSAQHLRKDLRNLKTDFALEKACDVELVRIAACWSVHQHAVEIQQWFADHNGVSTPSLDGLYAHIDQMCSELKGKWK